MIKAGDLVKIDDIGPLAQVLKKGRGRMYLRLDGEEFWCPTSIIKKGGGVRRWLSTLMMECFLVGIFAERVVVGETEQRKQQKELKRR